MSIRLGAHVINGFLDNRRPNTTHGTLHLRCTEGEGPADVRFELTGDCAPDLRGKLVRFWCACDPWECEPLEREKYNSFQWRQIGPTGKMSASGWVRALPCSVEEYMRRRNLGEKPPTPWVRHLYLEWFGQNGRMVVEMADPLVEWRPDEPKISDRPLESNEIWIPLPNLAVMPEVAREDAPPTGLGITEISHQGDTSVIEHWTECAKRHQDRTPEEALDEYLKEEARRLDAAIGDDDASAGETAYWDEEEEEEFAGFMRELEAEERILEMEGEPMLEIFAGALPPPVNTLTDNEVEARLKTLLARLAMFNISVDICLHCTPRDAYRILTEEVLPDARFHMELVGTDCVTHVSTSDCCAQCEEEALRDYEQMPPVEDDPDIPF